MHIVHVDTQMSWRGGEQQIMYLSQFLHAQGHRSVMVCQPHSALYHRAEDAGLPVRPLRMRHELDLLAAWQLGGYLQQQRADIVHMHTAHAHTIGLLACRRAPQVRQVVSRRVDFAPICQAFSRWKYLQPHIQYITVSEAVRQILTGSGIPPDCVATVHSGIDLQRFHGVQEAPSLFPAGTRVIGAVGHLADHKGHRDLVEATALMARQEPDVRVVIAGDGELRRALETQAAALGVMDRLCFTGFRQDILALMQSFEIFVMPSHLEGLGTAVLDAMALRKPVVAAQAGGIPEMVQHGRTGFLVPPRDAGALVEAIRFLLHHPEQRKAFGIAGRQRVEQYFTATRMASRTCDIYQRLLTHAAAPISA